MKKAVITILGKINGEKALYKTACDCVKEGEYINTLPLLINNFKGYEIVPVYTEDAKIVQEEVLKKEGLNEIDFNKGVFIEDDMDFYELLKKIDAKINKYDEVIFDISHGFRHLPILSTIDLIIQNLKSTKKIKHILFAKEIVPRKKYEIIDLFKYLDLANIAMMINIFKQNYTVSKHIEIRDKKYKKIKDLMAKFSDDLMALSIENLFFIANDLINELKNFKKDAIFKKEIDEIINILEKVYTKKSHRYETYYYIADDAIKKGYLAIALSLLFEGSGFFIKTILSEKSEKLKNQFDLLEEKIKNGENNLTYYDLVNFTQNIIKYKKEKFKKSKKIYDVINFDLDEIYKIVDEFYFPFKKFLYNISNLRNNLLHANSSEKIEDVLKKINTLRKSYNL